MADLTSNVIKEGANINGITGSYKGLVPLVFASKANGYYCWYVDKDSGFTPYYGNTSKPSADKEIYTNYVSSSYKLRIKIGTYGTPYKFKVHWITIPSSTANAVTATAISRDMNSEKYSSTTLLNAYSTGASYSQEFITDENVSMLTFQIQSSSGGDDYAIIISMET